MCFTVDKIEQACGFLLLNEFSVFVYYCKMCQSEFNSGTNLEAHWILEHQEDRKNCENIFVDDGIFEDLTDLKTVVKLEAKILDGDDDKELVSSKVEDVEHSCKYKVTAPDELRRGERTLREKGGNSTVNDIQSTKSNDSDRFNHRSNESIKESSNKNQTTKRQIRNSGKQRANGRASTEVFYCDMCPAITVNFNCKENLKQHMRRHIANKVRKACTICQKVPLNYEKHMKTNHLEASPYKCDFCGAAFKNNSNRVIHIRSHTGERPFLCQYCGKAFKSQDTRNKHNMRMHTKKLPHHCLPCNRSFICPSQLLEHQYSFHSKERPYNCEICGNSYSTKKYLRKHKQSHGERIHACKYCEKKFKTSDTRRWHERTVHNAV